MKKGFTLIEVVGVLILLSIIALLMVPAIDKQLKAGKEDMYQKQRDNIILGVKAWVKEYVREVPEKNEAITLSLYQLKQSGMVEPDIIDPKTNDYFSDNTVITISKDSNGKLEYKVVPEANQPTKFADQLVLELNEPVLKYIEVNSFYSDAPISAKDELGNDITSKITKEYINGNIDITKLKTYTIKYQVLNNDKKVTVYQTVIVRDTMPPVLTIDENDLKLELSYVNYYDFSTGVKATDNSGLPVDVHVEKQMTNQLGVYNLIYVATDKSLNSTKKYRSLTVTKDTPNPAPFTLNYTGNIQEYIVPKNGVYVIEATGAAGSVGNTFGWTGETPKGGNGAKISAEFSLRQGDVITVVVGGVGTSATNTAADGTSGAGGGGTFIFKQIPSITDSRYQFTKSSVNYETLIVAAGGGGTNDIGFQKSLANGQNGIGDTWYSPTNFTAFSTATTVGATNSVLGITQFINNNSIGGTYTRGVVCKGGFGGGGCADDNASYGGGWSGSSYQARSFSSGANTSGATGFQTTNGSVIIKMK